MDKTTFHHYETLLYSRPPMIWPPSHILMSRPVPSFVFLTCDSELICLVLSSTHDPESLCSTQHLYLLGYRAHCHESLPTRHPLRTRNHPSILRQEERRSRAAPVRHRRGRLHRHEQGWHGSDYHRIGRKVCSLFDASIQSSSQYFAVVPERQSR